MAALTAPAGEKLKYWDIGVSSYQLIDLATVNPPSLPNMAVSQAAEAFQLVSWFGERHIEECVSLFEKNYPVSHIVDKNTSRDFLGNLITQPLSKLGYKGYNGVSISVHLACSARHQEPYPVLQIPRKLWIKLRVFLDVTKNDITVKEDMDGAFLYTANDNLIKSVNAAVNELQKYSYFFDLENEASGLSILLSKDNFNNIFYYFNAERVDGKDSKLASYMANIPSQKLTYYGALDITSDTLTSLCDAIKTIKSLNASFLGLITADLSYLSSSEGISYDIEIHFLNPSIANFILYGGNDAANDTWLINYDAKRPLVQHSDYEDRFLKKVKNAAYLLMSTNDRFENLLESLKQRERRILENIPYDIGLTSEENAIGLEKPLPYALIKRYALSKRPTRRGYYFIYHSTQKTCVELLAGLFEERFNFMKMLVQEVKTSKALTVVINNDEDVLAVCESLLEYCDDQIEQREENSKKSSPFDLFSAAKSDKRTDLLQESIRYYKENFEYTLQTECRIQNLQQLMNTQEKRNWVFLCDYVIDHKDDKEPYYNYVRKNSALLFLKQHLILTHPYYTAAQVWASIKDKPVMYYGSGRHYQDESGVNLTLENIIKTVPSMKKCIQSLVTVTLAMVDDREISGLRG